MDSSILSLVTPVEYIGAEQVWVKRDDLFEVCGVRGGKSRAAYMLITELIDKGYTTMVTAGSRQSPQCEIVSCICEELGINCKVFMPNGADTSVIQHIKENSRTEIIRVKPGYNNVIIARAREYAEERNLGYIPFGMECAKNVEVTKSQVVNLPYEEMLKCGGRLVIPVGSGMSISSVISGLSAQGMYNLPVLGVRVGKSPDKIIEKYAEGYFSMSNVEIVSSPIGYHTPVEAYVGDIQLDPIYEAKCRAFLKPGDCLWIVGKRVL